MVEVGGGWVKVIVGRCDGVREWMARHLSPICESRGGGKVSDRHSLILLFVKVVEEVR